VLIYELDGMCRILLEQSDWTIRAAAYEQELMTLSAFLWFIWYLLRHLEMGGPPLT